MDSPASRPREKYSGSLKVIAWVIWVLFLVATLVLFGLIIAIKNDPFFARHYSQAPMNFATVVTTTYPMWVALLPFLGLPLVILFQRSARPKLLVLLLLSALFFFVDLGILILILFTGPPMQM